MLISISAKADEGMWLLPLLSELNETDMINMGLEITADDIYSVDTSCLKDAVVIFGSGCTGEFVSSEGLLFTNHHCGYNVIQQHSSVENNYLLNGFWAKDRNEEIPSPGLTVKQLVSIENITDSILMNINDEMNESERSDSVAQAIIRFSASADTMLQLEVNDFFSGNAYYRFAYRTFRDVRLVGAPPSSIGKFGAETDNWMWPRHTGDFSIFRVYVSPDGLPAEYSEDNVPYNPKHYLKISMKGVENGDFTMTLGFPGSTNRYMASWGIEQRMQISNQTIIDARKVRQDIWMNDMQKDSVVQLQYASKYANSSNYYKNSIGMNKQLRKLNVVEEKRRLEADFSEWVNADAERIAEYGDVLDILKKTYEDRACDLQAYYNVLEILINSIEIYQFALQIQNLTSYLDENNEAKFELMIKDFKEAADLFYKDYNADTDKKMVITMFELYSKVTGEQKLPNFSKYIKNGFRSSDMYADYLFNKSMFACERKFNKFLEKPRLKKFYNDPAYFMATRINEEYYKRYDALMEYEPLLNYAYRKYEKGLQQMLSDKDFYPDANFTMRLSYGEVGGYKLADAVHYDYYTTLDGVIEKEDSDNWEFVVPEKLKELYVNKDYGRYADENGDMRVCFITSNDVTGGNSGSPLLNSRGELAGLVFDSNWEGVSGDISFEDELQRVINVDIRYVLFIIDKFAGASYLIDEMELVN